MPGLLFSALTLTFFFSRLNCQLLQVLRQGRCGLLGLPVQANCGLAHRSGPLIFVVAGIGWYTLAAPAAPS